MPLRRRSHTALVSLLLASLLLLGCSASTEITSLEDAGTEQVADDESGTEADELSSQEVYRTIADSVVFVEAPDGQSTGSGIVIEDGWILTNAHVVERFESVRIGRSNGDDLGLHPVHAVDWVFDLALVGPITDTALVAMERGVSADLELGSRVLLAGFPDEDSNDPTPTLTEGIVSRRRYVGLGDYPFLQVDATIAPGQSGGALVNGRGELVGISGLEFGLGEFGLVFASDPMWPRVDDLIVSTASEIPTGPAVSELLDEVGPLRKFGFTVEVDESGELDLQITGDTDVFVDLQSLGGLTVNQSEAAVDPFRGLATDGRLFFDDRSDGNESVIATLEPGTYQVVIGSFGETVSSVSVTSTSELRRFIDVEEDAVLPVGEIVEGAFDWSQDSDKWQLALESADRVSIRADGIADTVIVVRLDGRVVTSSDDEGIGLFGTGSQVDFVAGDTGVYTIEVGTFDSDRWGYLIEATVN